MILLLNVYAALSAAEPCICAVDPWSSTTLPWSRAALVPLQTAATPSTPRCDLAFQMTCEFTYQWIYYLQDVCAASDPECASPLPLQIIGMALIPACNLGASKLCVAEAFIQWSYGVSPTKRLGGARAGGALVKTGHAFSLTLAEKGAPSWTIVRDAARGVLAVNLTTDDGAPLRFEIADDRGMSPQGNDGYVKSGFGACDTAYSCSFLRTTLRQVDAATPAAAARGVGYGEWVHGTMPPQNASVLLAPKQNALALAPSNAPRNAPTPPPNATTSTGWHCFYLHLTTANGTADLDMCHSHNPAMAQFQRVQMLTPNGTRVWAEGPGAAQATPLRWWTSAATNATFAVVWRVHVPPPLDMWVLATNGSIENARDHRDRCHRRCCDILRSEKRACTDVQYREQEFCDCDGNGEEDPPPALPCRICHTVVCSSDRGGAKRGISCAADEARVDKVTLLNRGEVAVGIDTEILRTRRQVDGGDEQNVVRHPRRERDRR